MERSPLTVPAVGLGHPSGTVVTAKRSLSACLLSFREICVSLGLFLKTPLDYLPDLCFPVLPQPLITEKMDVNGLSTSKMGMGGVLAGSDVRLRLSCVLDQGERVLLSSGEGEFCLLSICFLADY